MESIHAQKSSIKMSHAGLCGATAGVFTDVFFYGLDSYKTVRQAGGKVVFSKLYRGFLPVTFLGTGVANAFFFSIYYPVRNGLRERFPHWEEGSSVLAASLISAVPASLVSVPADVLKKEVLVGYANSAVAFNLRSVLTNMVKTEGYQRLFLGWKVNVLRDVSYAALEMSVYEGLARLYLSAKETIQKGDVPRVGYIPERKALRGADQLSGLQAAGVGFAAGIITATLTTPLDCVNTRIKTGELAHCNILQAHMTIVQKDGVLALFRGLGARAAIAGFASTLFWYTQATLMRIMHSST